jgi:hypothetical protein
MKKAALLVNNTVIRLIGEKYEITSPEYTYSGHLSSFNIINERYAYTDSWMVNETEIKGYCKQDIIKKYTNNLIKTDVFTRKENWFDDSFEPAKVGDIFEIEKVDFYDVNGQPDFVNYYNKISYSFRIQKFNIRFDRSSNYPQPFNVHNNVNDPAYSVRAYINRNHNNSITGRIYKKNFGDKVNGLISAGVPLETIEVMAEYMIYICFRIYWILEEKLLDVIAIEDLTYINSAASDKYYFFVNNPNDPGNTYNTLTPVDKIIAELLKDWWVVHNVVPNPLLEGRDLFPVLDIDLLQKHATSVSNFYRFLHLKDENKLFLYDVDGNPLNQHGIPLTTVPADRKAKDSDRRIIAIIDLLPSIAFSLFPPADRLKILEKVLEYSEIKEDRPQVFYIGPGSSLLEDSSIFIEDDIIKLVNSFESTYDEANMLMNFLLETKKYDGEKEITKFERLYSLIDDKHLDNIFVIGWFVDEENNRARLILSLFNIWEKSKYYFYSIPPGIPLAENGTNPQNPFLYDAAWSSYYAKYDDQGKIISGSEPILEFTIDELGEGYKLETKYKVAEDLQKQDVEVRKFTQKTHAYIPTGGGPDSYFNNGSFYGYYHLYQTITLIGYKVDEDLVTTVPKMDMSFIPAFLFYYVEEFDRLKNIDAAISFVFEVIVEVGLFFATAGASAATSLRHLRHLTKLRHIRIVNGTFELAGIAAGDAMLVWRVAEGSAEIVAMTSSIVASYLNYLGTVTDNPFYRRLSYFFIAFTLASAGGAIFSNRRVVKLADEVLDNIPPGHVLPTEIRDILMQVRGKRLAILEEFANRLQNLPLAQANLIYSRYANLTPELRNIFLADFSKLTDINSWNRLNNATVLDNWVLLAQKNIAERQIIDFVTNQNLVDTIVKFYDQPLLRELLEKLDTVKKISFLDNFKQINPSDFNRFVNKPELINYWFRYFDDAASSAAFTAMSRVSQLDFIEAFGTISTFWFNRLKKQPELFSRFNTASAASRALAKIAPKYWIRVNRKYVRPGSLLNRLSESAVLNRFGTEGVRLVNTVETKARQLMNSGLSRTELSKDHQLVSGMVDKETGVMSEMFTNFTREELKAGGAYEIFLNNSMHPNLKAIVDELLTHGQSTYHMADPSALVYTGKNIAAHAEVRALDNLIKKRFGNGLIDEARFNDWLDTKVLGYNRNIVVKNINEPKIIMHTCADCFYITDLVTFIK